MKLWIRAELLRLTNIRASDARKMGDPGPEGSVAKLAKAELYKDIYAFAVTTMGREGMLYREYEMSRPNFAMANDYLQKTFLRSRANSIEGGTSEVMRNILGERVLGLPATSASTATNPGADSRVVSWKGGSRGGGRR